MTNQEVDLETYFKKMLGEIEDLMKTDEILKKDWKKNDMKLQWFLNGMKGYQIFEDGKYTHVYGGEIDDADLTIEFNDNEMALKLLKGNLTSYSYSYYKRKFKLYSVEKREEVERKHGMVIIRHLKPLLTAYFTKGIVYHPSVLTRLPLFREIIVKHSEPSKTKGSYIPINTSLGTFENQLMPEKMLEHFIRKAKHFYIQTVCLCRVYRDCQDHDRFIGCMYIGDDVAKLKLPAEKGRFITQEEALEHARKGLENGLVPVFGRAPGETNALNLEDTGHVMSMCFCCPCCCVNGKIANNATLEVQNFTRMEGLTVEVDPNICEGCGTCLEVCVFVGRSIIDGKAVIDQERCLGCGRCERACPNGAIKITLDDPKRIEEHIQSLEESVDVS